MAEAATIETQKPAESETTTKEKKEPYKATRPRLQQAEHDFMRMSYMLEAGKDLKSLLVPGAWSNLAYLFHRQQGMDKDYAGAIIEVRTEDHAFYAELYVRAVLERDLVVAVLKDATPLGLQKVRSSGFRLQWNLPERGWDVVRNVDNEKVGLAKNLKTKEAAQDYIDKMSGG